MTTTEAERIQAHVRGLNLWRRGGAELCFVAVLGLESDRLHLTFEQGIEGLADCGITKQDVERLLVEALANVRGAM